MTKQNGFAENKRYYEEMFKQNLNDHSEIKQTLKEIKDQLTTNIIDYTAFKTEMKNETSGRARLWGILGGLIPALVILIYWIIRGAK